MAVPREMILRPSYESASMPSRPSSVRALSSASVIGSAIAVPFVSSPAWDFEL